MNNMQEKRETLLPPPELLERYENISKGLSRDLLTLVKNEQEHRHKLQDKYFMHFRIGQIFGAVFLLYIISMVFELAKAGNIAIAYLMAGLFGLLIVLILFQYKKDKIQGITNNF
ncbi:MAG: DUF2335 domain-containing protein, partial [Rickettsiales bacterium]|nr:DUF2335 domain-containing protein [Rickettsiales bacterium]